MVRARSRAILLRGVWPLVPPGVQAAVQRVRRKSGFPDYMTDPFTASTDLADRLRPVRTGLRGRSRTHQELLDWFSSGAMMRGHELDDRHHAWFGVEARHPLHDRRIIEFTLGIPESQRWRAAQTKYVLRQAVGDRLPSSVRTRQSRGDYSSTFIGAFDACGGEACFQRMELAERGWIRADAVGAAYRAMRAAHAAGDLRYALWTIRLWMIYMIYGLELWLQHRAQR